jgi:hypothetical protein
MRMSELFINVPTTGKAPKPPAGQFEFSIDRAGRKILSTWGVFARGEQVRVQTNRLFTWAGTVSLPDNTTGMTREVECVLEFEGFAAPNEADARTLLKAALDADFDLDRLIRRLATEAVDEQRAKLKGSFLGVMRDPASRQGLLDGVSQKLRLGGVPVTKLSLLPVLRDQRDFLDFEDTTGSISIRTGATLETSTFGFKARLRWGPTEEQRNARLIYRGSIDGVTPGPALALPLVPGQIQPLEAWFRQLLRDAVARHPSSAVQNNDASLLDTLRTEISAQLGRGTGRVLEALELLPTSGRQARMRERTVTFSHQYRITGVQGESLTIEHTLGYALLDRDRWVAQGSPHPEEAIKPQVIEAMRGFLAGKRFKDVVALYLQGAQGEAKLRDAITTRVSPYVNSIGVRLVSTAVILSIPEKHFVEGRRLEFPIAQYSLSDPHLAPPMKLSLTVRVAPNTDAREAFARALTEHDAFENQVNVAVQDAVRDSLRRVKALQYYASHFVNGEPDALPGMTPEPAPDDPVRVRLRNEVDAELRARFGLEVVRIDLEPGKEDWLVERMGALKQRSIEIPEGTRITFERGDEWTRVLLDVEGTIFIDAIDKAHWNTFYSNAARIDSAEMHATTILNTLKQTLRMTHAAVVSSSMTDERGADLRQQVVDIFTARIGRELGLVVHLSLMLHIKRPGASDTADVVLTDLHRELRKLSNERAQLITGSTYMDSERRDAISRHIDIVRADIAEEERRQEATIARTETICIEQDRRTGRLIGDARRNETPE